MSDNAASDTEIWRTDRENDRVIMGETAIELVDENGEQLVFDHASSADGYVAFSTEGCGNRVGPSRSIAIHFREVNDD